MSKALQMQALKYLAMGVAGYFIYQKVTGAAGEAVEAAAEIVSTRLNPASDQNLVYVGVQEVVGEEALSSAGLSFFDAVDSAAEWVGFETGINGIKGSTADANEALARG